MNEDGNGPTEQSPEEIEAELKRVEAERDELEARVETIEARPKKRQRMRRIFTPILVALSILVFTVTVPAVWGARTVLNTDRYVATVGPLAEDPAVQASIATKLTDQVFLALDVEGTLSEVLGAIGERATVLAGPLTTAVRGFVQDQVLKVVQSDAFQTFWVEANRFVHTQVLAILRGEGDTVSVVEGKVLLNLLPLVNLALGSIERGRHRSGRPGRDAPDDRRGRGAERVDHEARAGARRRSSRRRTGRSSCTTRKISRPCSRPSPRSSACWCCC